MLLLYHLENYLYFASLERFLACYLDICQTYLQNPFDEITKNYLRRISRMKENRKLLFLLSSVAFTELNVDVKLKIQKKDKKQKNKKTKKQKNAVACKNTLAAHDSRARLLVTIYFTLFPIHLQSRSICFDEIASELKVAH